MPDYQSTVQAVVSAIVNEHVERNSDLLAKVGKDQFLINHILDVLEGQGYLKLEKFGTGQWEVSRVSVKLRRAFGAGQIDA